MQTFRDLRVWREGVHLAVEVCRAVRGFPVEDRYDLGSQLKRSAISIPSNIAEGEGRLTPRDRRRFLGNARGSINELETQLEIARLLELISHHQYEQLLSALDGVSRALSGLIKYVSSRVNE